MSECDHAAPAVAEVTELEAPPARRVVVIVSCGACGVRLAFTSPQVGAEGLELQAEISP